MGKSRKNVDRVQRAVFDRAVTEQIYYDRLYNCALGMWEYKLPKTINVAFMERKAIKDGSIVIFKDPDIGHLALPYRINSRDLYGNPKSRTAFSPVNGYTYDLDETNSVILYNNELKKPEIQVLRKYASDLANIDQIIQVNLNAQRYPILIRCTEDMRVSMLNAYEQYESGVPVIFGDNRMNSAIASMQAVSTTAPYVADKTFQLKLEIWNEAMTALGVPNNAVSKRERVNTIEIERALGGTDVIRNSRFKPRVVAMEQAKDLWPEEEWSVRFAIRSDTDSENELMDAEREIAKQTKQTNQKEDGADG